MGNIMKRELIASKIFAPEGAHYPIKKETHLLSTSKDMKTYEKI